jgi:hypothetical protein
VLVACASASLPLLSAQAQDAISNQAYAQMNQVQNQLNSGMINPSQASDLMNRYNNILQKDAQYSAQDGGRLNLPDQMSLQGKLSGTVRRAGNDMRNNGYAANGGLLSNFLQGGTNYNAYGYGNQGYGNQGYGLTGYNGYGGGGGGGCHHHHHNGMYGNSGYGSTAYGAPMNTAVMPYTNGAYPVTPVGYSGVNPYMATPGVYNNGLNGGVINSGLLNSGMVQGLLSRWRGY